MKLVPVIAALVRYARDAAADALAHVRDKKLEVGESDFDPRRSAIAYVYRYNDNRAPALIAAPKRPLSRRASGN